MKIILKNSNLVFAHQAPTYQVTRGTLVSGYYCGKTGVFTAVDSFNSYIIEIQSGSARFTGSLAGAACCVAYFNGEPNVQGTGGTFIGYDANINGNQSYTNEQLTLPANATHIVVSGQGDSARDVVSQLI